MTYRVIAVIESEVEAWFDDARVRTLIVVVEKGGIPVERDPRFRVCS